MKGIIQDISEITDSKEIYAARPHPFLSIFIYILLVAIVAIGIWMYYGEIDIVSKGRGVIRPNENMSIIRNRIGGVISENHLEEGKEVKKGEVLFRIDYGDLQIKQIQLKEKIEEEKRELENLKKLRESIEIGKNLFSLETEKEYYEKYIKYVQDGEALKRQVAIDTRSEEVGLEQTHLSKLRYEESIEEYTKKLSDLEDYKASVEAKENKFADQNCIEYLLFNTYIYNEKELEQQIKDKALMYKLNEELESQELLAPRELEASKEALELVQNEQIKLKLNTLKEIDDDIETYRTLKEAAEKEQEQLIVDANLLSNKAEQRILSIKQYKTDTLVALNNQIQTLEVSLQSQMRELEVIELSITDCSVVASIDGTINMLQNINVGDLVSQGTEVARIIPKDTQLYKVEILVPNSEIAGLKEGEIVEYRFDALPYKEYGKLRGHITNISTDALDLSESGVGISGYYVTGALENKEVYSYKGERVNLKVGMTCDASIIVEQKKVLYYLLEKINLKE